jgi:hypothetical protein
VAAASDVAAVISAAAALVGTTAAAYDIWARRKDHRLDEDRTRRQQERAQAGQVFAWAYGRTGQDYLVYVENRSDAPIRELFAVVEPQQPGQAVTAGRRVLGLLPAGESARPGAPVHGQPDDDTTKVRVELIFTDAEGRTWRRQDSHLERGEIIVDSDGARWRSLLVSSPARLAPATARDWRVQPQARRSVPSLSGALRPGRRCAECRTVPSESSPRITAA